MNKGRSTALGLVSLVGLAVLLAGTAFAPPSQAQSVTPAPAAPAPLTPAPLTPAQRAAAACTAGGFDVCFPNLTSGAPNAACTPTEAGSAAVTACLGLVCRSAATEPEPGFFSYCCSRGGSVQYDEFCAFVVQSECAAVATHCASRCPPVQLLIGTVTLAPPTAACIATYPAFISAVCAQDAFCCSTSWDAICAQAALAAGGSALATAASVPSSAAITGVITPSTAVLAPAVLAPAVLAPAAVAPTAAATPAN